MPSVLRVRGFRFFFFSLEGREPAHIHVEKAGKYAKFWLSPLSLARSRGFQQHELADILHIIEQYEGLLKEKWDEYARRRV